MPLSPKYLRDGNNNLPEFSLYLLDSLLVYCYVHIFLIIDVLE